MKLVAGLPLFISIFAGCATTSDDNSPGRAIGRYFLNRGLDALDIFDVSVGAGKYARVDIQYLVGNWGGGWADTYRARLGGRSLLTQERAGGFALFPPPLPQIVSPILFLSRGEHWNVLLLAGMTEEAERAVSPSAFSQGVVEMLRWWSGCWSEQQTRGPNNQVLREQWWAPAAIGAEVHCFVGLRVRIYPVQFVDFLTGIFGYDLLHDDL
jgi:hypothetical protein